MGGKPGRARLPNYTKIFAKDLSIEGGIVLLDLTHAEPGPSDRPRLGVLSCLLPSFARRTIAALLEQAVFGRLAYRFFPYPSCWPGSSAAALTGASSGALGASIVSGAGSSSRLVKRTPTSLLMPCSSMVTPYSTSALAIVRLL
jgi:hypothetical protein